MKTPNCCGYTSLLAWHVTCQEAASVRLAWPVPIILNTAVLYFTVQHQIARAHTIRTMIFKIWHKFVRFCYCITSMGQLSMAVCPSCSLQRTTSHLRTCHLACHRHPTVAHATVYCTLLYTYSTVGGTHLIGHSSSDTSDHVWYGSTIIMTGPSKYIIIMICMISMISSISA